MPRLSDPQFSHYEFRANRSTYPKGLGVETSVAVAQKKEAGYRALGAMVITQDDTSYNDYQQSLIDRGFHQHQHGVNQDPGGQQRWSGGNFEPLPSRVSWLGMSVDAPKTLLKGVMGLGVAVHGSTPVADYDLSQHGAKIAQGAARKYGVKPHPNNPSMENTFSYDDDSAYPAATANAAAEQVAHNHWANSNYAARQWSTFTPEQVHHITRGVEEQLGLKKPDPRIPVHPSQGKLF